MRSLQKKIAGGALTLLATVLLGGLLSATLVRLAPGFSVDERELDPHLNAQSVQALREAKQRDHNVFRFYFSYMNRAFHGDLGTSLALNQPVRTLLREDTGRKKKQASDAEMPFHIPLFSKGDKKD